MLTINPLDAVIPADARIVILGSLPGTASLTAGQYYAHRSNQFWRLMAAVTGRPLPDFDYTDRLAELAHQRIGLWDMVGAAERSGSLDMAIRAASLRDVSAVLRGLPALRCVAFNGKYAAKAGRNLAIGGAVNRLELPSSSAANTMSFELKRKAWLGLCAYLENNGSGPSGQ